MNKVNTNSNQVDSIENRKKFSILNSQFSIILALIAIACNSSHKQADAYGNFEAREVIVSAQGSGQIILLNIEEGARLNVGDIVGLIDTSTQHFKKQQLAAQYAATQAQFSVLQAQSAVQQQQIDNLSKDLTRISNMKNDGAATQKQLDDVLGAIDVAKKQISAIESQRASLHSQLLAINAQIAEVNNNISKHIIANPQEGVVLVKYAESGETTALGKPLFKIGDVDNMKLKAYISESQLSSVKLGQAVQVSFDIDKGTVANIEGEIIWISDKAEFTPKIIQTREERVNLVYAFKVAVKNDGRIKIGMPGEVRFN